MIIAPCLTQYHSYKGDGFRGQPVDRPLMTVDTNPRYGLAACFLSKYYGTGGESSLKVPLHTITSKDRNALIEAHLCVLRNNMDCKNPREPMPTIMTSAGHFAAIKTILSKIDGNQDLDRWPEVREMLNKYCGYNMADDEILLFQINEELYFISDIGLRMLEPRELFNAQGFPVDYIIDRDYKGNRLSKSDQVAKCGNAVPPVFAEALTGANLPELCGGEVERQEKRYVY